MKRPSELKRMSERALSKYRLDLEDELLAISANLSLARREQRARRKRKSQRRSCGKRTTAPELTAPSSELIH